MLSYPATDIYIIGYSCASLISLNNIEAKWMKEIMKSRDDNNEDDQPWIIMVGTKATLHAPCNPRSLPTLIPRPCWLCRKTSVTLP